MTCLPGCGLCRSCCTSGKYSAGCYRGISFVVHFRRLLCSGWTLEPDGKATTCGTGGTSQRYHRIDKLSSRTFKLYCYARCSLDYNILTIFSLKINLIKAHLGLFQHTLWIKVEWSVMILSAWVYSIMDQHYKAIPMVEQINQIINALLDQVVI